MRRANSALHADVDVDANLNEERRTMNRFIEAKPYPWPYNGDLRPDNTALVIIDMQTDF